jgi:hypothetical protein
MLIYLWIPKSPARTDAIIRESSAILLFFGVVETKKFEASQMVLTVSLAWAFPTAGWGGFPVRHSIGRLERRPNPQGGKPALHLGSRSQQNQASSAGKMPAAR